jgi:hypothetical protein
MGRLCACGKITRVFFHSTGIEPDRSDRGAICAALSGAVASMKITLPQGVTLFHGDCRECAAFTAG